MANLSVSPKTMNVKAIQVFAGGTIYRLTFIDDIVEGILAILSNLISEKPPVLMNISNAAEYPVTINHLIIKLEHALGHKAQVEYLPMQKGDVDIKHLQISSDT